MTLSKQTLGFLCTSVAALATSLVAQTLWHADWLEVVSFFTAVVGLYLLTVEVTWGWPLAILSSAGYALFFYRGALYADMSLNIFYVIMLVHGWTSWGAKLSSKEHLPVSRLVPKQWLLVLLSFAIGLAIYVPIVLKWKGSAPLVDSTLAVASYIAQFMQNRKFLENWAFWMVINAGYVVLYAIIKPYYLTALLSVLLIILSVLGHVNWSKSLREQSV